ncbi:hypothetical protein [Halomonas nitroreducens]|uniref:HK97 gp10 family phage protein n=1 Tax=Halomonas nitroreducens TaxID=447425 RepID=A0A3S0I6W9_9GAMM|nr:hypothetical protein [Halomonas nitroreducens]RTR01941.1 hypothetical protein EKG36_13110 [Halomonas nitroreducens]
MSGFNVQVSGAGFEQARRDMAGLEHKLQHGAVRAGMVRAIAPVKKTAKANAPKDSGDLARAVGHRSLSKRAKGRLGLGADTVALLVGTNRRVGGRWQGRKGLWQEHGTEHMTANPFLGPALEQHQSGFGGRFYAGLSRYLDRKGLRP